MSLTNVNISPAHKHLSAFFAQFFQSYGARFVFLGLSFVE